MRNDEQATPLVGGVRLHHAVIFWIGIAAVVAGALAHLPMYLMGRDIGYRLVGMPMDTTMLLGMFAIVAGLAATLYGLLPPRGEADPAGARIRVAALDDVPLGATHVGLVLAMMFAVTIDVMKPTALAFVMPGMTLEYDLLSPLNPTGSTPVVLLPVCAITGMVLGSFLWGFLGDRIGRRASILYAGVGFIGTSICGAMPSFAWNVLMCFLMGVCVGGMLPICYALLAEMIPARHRGWLMVLVGADVAGAYIVTSALAAALVPTFSWRILWLIGFPTGVAFILLNRWIPESPRFLLLHGREAEARRIMARYGALVVEDPVEPSVAHGHRRWSELVQRGLLGRTILLGCIGLGSGLVLFGFNLWIPTNLRKLGLTDADAILRNAALFGFPLTFVVAWLYGFWSSKWTIVGLCALTAAALFGFAVMGDAVADHRTLLYALLVAPIWGVSCIVAALSVYSAEIYPTAVRSRGTGYAAGMSKAGGGAVIALVVLGLATPSVATVASIGALPLALAVVLMLVFGVETRNRSLEDISGSALARES